MNGTAGRTASGFGEAQRSALRSRAARSFCDVAQISDATHVGLEPDRAGTDRNVAEAVDLVAQARDLGAAEDVRHESQALDQESQPLSR